MEFVELRENDLDEFKQKMQESFQKAYEDVCGKSDELILPENDISKSLKNKDCHAYEMIDNGEIVGGVIVNINEKTNHNHLDFLFVSVNNQNRGLGQKIWKEIENKYSKTEIWETCTPYFDKRNIHFYVNKLKFQIVEYQNEKNKDPNMPNENFEEDGGMFIFQKVMKK